jgi:hypothetical protein
MISDHQTAMQRHIKTQIRAVPLPLFTPSGFLAYFVRYGNHS